MSSSPHFSRKFSCCDHKAAQANCALHTVWLTVKETTTDQQSRVLNGIFKAIPLSKHFFFGLGKLPQSLYTSWFHLTSFLLKFIFPSSQGHRGEAKPNRILTTSNDFLPFFHPFWFLFTPLSIYCNKTWLRREEAAKILRIKTELVLRLGYKDNCTPGEEWASTKLTGRPSIRLSTQLSRASWLFWLYLRRLIPHVQAVWDSLFWGRCIPLKRCPQLFPLKSVASQQY